jgi:hypothetical protein
VTIRILGSAITDNDDDGLDAEQESPGVGTLRLSGTNVSGNGDDDLELDGVDLV